MGEDTLQREKLQREVEKLTEEVRVLQHPFSQPSSWIATVALLLSIGSNIWQFHSSSNDETLSRIRKEKAELDEAKAIKGLETAQKAQKEAEDRITALGEDEKNITKVRDQYIKNNEEQQKELNSLNETLVAAQKSGNPEELNKTITQVRQNINSLQQTSQKTAQKINNSESKQTVKFKVAAAKEREGFEDLINGNYDSAIAAFQAAEDAYNSYHNVYELARLIKANKSQMNDPAKKKEVFQTIVNNYSGL